MSREMRLEILEVGDKVVGFSDNRIAVSTKNGEVKIYTISFDEENIPRIQDRVAVICRKTSAGRKVSIRSKDKKVEIGSF